MPTDSTAPAPETIASYRAELEATGKVCREGVTLTYDAAAVTHHIRNPEPAPWVLDYGKGRRGVSRGVINWRAQSPALTRFAGEVRSRMNARLAPIREAEELAARIAAPVDLARVIDLLESAAASLGEWDDREEHPLAVELRAAVAKLRADGVTL